eukprot:GFUD01079284.1.p1 GENE.GFUD01079284.1~~GFUD01079284.1.p1  ORF type:complete len:135 (+),score=36.98 GFUD01079284.1:18-422(+)
MVVLTEFAMLVVLTTFTTLAVAQTNTEYEYSNGNSTVTVPKSQVASIRALAEQSNKSSAERCCDSNKGEGGNSTKRKEKRQAECSTPCFWISWCPYFVLSLSQVSANPVCCLHPTVTGLAGVADLCCEEYQLCV